MLAPNTTGSRSNYQHAPQKSPFPPPHSTEQNIHRLKNWLLEHFTETPFKNNGEFAQMSGRTAHIYLKEGAAPKARHSPFPVPFHLKKPVRQALWEDVKRSIITQVPVGMPTDWCCPLVVTAKTIDYQHLNSQCKRETHHTGSPFQLALHVPTKQKKTL